MSKLKKLKAKTGHHKSSLTLTQKKIGKLDLYILLSMIAIGIAVALYNMN